MDEDINKEYPKSTQVATKEKLGLGIKVVVTVVVLGSIAAGIFIAIILAK